MLGPVFSGEWTECPLKDCHALAEVLPGKPWVALGYKPAYVRVRCWHGHNIAQARSSLVIDDGEKVVP